MKKCANLADEFLFHECIIYNKTIGKCKNTKTNPILKYLQVQLMSFYYINVETIIKCGNMKEN